jgi:hypothetical protein
VKRFVNKDLPTPGPPYYKVWGWAKDSWGTVSGAVIFAGAILWHTTRAVLRWFFTAQFHFRRTHFWMFWSSSLSSSRPYSSLAIPCHGY